MGTAARGNAAEAAVLAAFVKRGYEVLVPFGDGHPYDLGVELGTSVLRVQCKRAWPSKGCLVFNSHSTDHGKGRRSYLGLADLFGVYFPQNDNVYLVPVSEIVSVKGSLRLEPTRNNQRRGVRFAADYEIDRWTLNGLRQVVVETNPTPELELSIA
jgi:PD-(D/E)XK endonuclease